MDITTPDHRPCEKCLRVGVTLHECPWCSSRKCAQCLTPEEIIADCCKQCQPVPVAQEDVQVLQMSMN